MQLCSSFRTWTDGKTGHYITLQDKDITFILKAEGHDYGNGRYISYTA